MKRFVDDNETRKQGQPSRRSPNAADSGLVEYCCGIVATILWFMPLSLQAEEAHMTGGFVRSEASQMLELSAELNEFGVPNIPAPDTSRWEAVSEGKDPANSGKAAGGFGPFNNRWKLWRSKDGNDFVVVIRGTIYDADSIDEDLLANTLPDQTILIPAGKAKSISFRLASASYHGVDEEAKGWPVAEVQAGFAYGLAAILFDQRFGLIKALQALPEQSRLYVTGHSQGAAIATLLHSFLHYACADNKGEIAAEDRETFKDCARFGLNKKGFSIKSYVFAQPKPGNWRYAMDFAQSIGNVGLSYTIDNYDDPVVQVPLAFQLLSDSLTQQQTDSLTKQHRILDLLMRAAGGFRHFVSKGIDEKILDDRFFKDNGAGPYADHIDEAYANGPAKKIAEWGSSLNYSPVGNVISVRPHRDDNLEHYESTRKTDFLWEHHLWRYKQLAKYWP